MSIIPKRLKPGNRVAIVAPSSPFKLDELQEGIDIISSLGLVPVLGPNVKNLHVKMMHAGSLESRLNELMWAFTAPDISAVICAVGGFGCAELLPYLDYKKISLSKRPFITKSDGTALNNGIFTRSGLINFNARTPSIKLDKGDKFYQGNCESLVHTLRLLMTTNVWGDSAFSISNKLPRCVTPGMVSGIAIGGNLDTFTRLLSTDFIPSPKGSILFIEDTGKGSIATARGLLHLKMSGFLDELSGVVIGEFVDVPEKKGEHAPPIEDVIIEYFGDKIPTAYGYSFSHGEYTCPIPIGAMTTLNATNATVEFDFCMGG